MTHDPAILEKIQHEGAEFTVTGERGRFRFRGTNPDGSIAAWGGIVGREKCRDFRLERIVKVYRPKQRAEKQ